MIETWCSPVTLVDPSNMFWGFNQQIRYRGPSPGTGLQVLSLTSGIVDTRTTFTLIASGAPLYLLHRTPASGVYSTLT